MNKSKLIVASLVFITFIASLSIFSQIGKGVGNLPQATPIDIPTALRKAEESQASQHGEEATTGSIPTEENQYGNK
jgi:hypothetical protein